MGVTAAVTCRSRFIEVLSVGGAIGARDLTMASRRFQRKVDQCHGEAARGEAGCGGRADTASTVSRDAMTQLFWTNAIAPIRAGRILLPLVKEGGSIGFMTRALIIGSSVNETKSETSTAAATVRPNCRKNCPSFAGGEEGQRQSLYIGLPLPLPLHLHSVKES